MTRLLRSPFPVAPTTPAILQHDLFGGPPEALDAAGDVAPSTPAARRWCEIGGPEAASGEEHRSRPSQLARPGHSIGSRGDWGRGDWGRGDRGRGDRSRIDRELAILERALRTRAPKGSSPSSHSTANHSAANHSTPGAPSCGRTPGHQASSGASTSDRSTRSSARRKPIVIRRRRAQARPADLAPTDVRNVGARMTQVVDRGTSSALPMTSPAQAQPEWSCATAWLRSVEASGEGSMQQVTTAASYMFVAVMLAFTFVI